MDDLSIKLKIGNREYPMRVKSGDEEMIRNAGKSINSKIKSYKDQFGLDDFQDLLAMVAIDSMVENMKSDDIKSSTEEVAIDHVSRIKHILSQAI